ncbi:MAG: glycosyltransferase family 4 protein [Candidatus Hodarchaeota archaeon]
MSPKGKLASSMEFAEALRSLGVESICACDLDYCVLSEFKILKHVPFPRLLKLIKNFGPDFILTVSAYYTPHIAKLMQQPLLVFLHGDIWTEIVWNRRLYPFLPRRMLFEWKSLISSQGVRKADMILPICHWLENIVKKRLPNCPTGVLHVGIKSEDWNPICDVTSFDVKHPAVIGVFDLEFPGKISGLIEFVKCVKQMPNVHFYFAGGGPYVNSLKKIIPRNMFLLGKIPKPKVEEFLAAGDVFVHPSGWDALPLSLLEASAMEKPIVASRIGGIPEIVENNVTGYLCKLDDMGRWVERIRFFLDNPSIGKRFGRNARKHMKEEFDWKIIAQGFLENVKARAQRERHITKKKSDVVWPKNIR